MKRRRSLKSRRGKSGNTGFNMMMGAGGTQSTLSQFKNPNSSSSISTYNAFREMQNALGADNN